MGHLFHILCLSLASDKDHCFAIVQVHWLDFISIYLFGKIINTCKLFRRMNLLNIHVMDTDMFHTYVVHL